MKKYILSGLIAACLVSVPGLMAQAAKLPQMRILLVGDSTMAHKSGYGDAFCKQFSPEVTCLNFGHGGRSSKSFRVDGFWDKDVMTELQKTKAADGTPYARTYVLMQFGHNDGSPKPERHTDVKTEFPQNLSRYAKEAQATGAIFVLVTPLTMRNFENGKLLPDRVAPFAEATRKLAAAEHIPMIDLFAESQKAVQAMGLVKANHTLAGGPIPQSVLDSEASGTSVQPKDEQDASQVQGSNQQKFDYTHLNQTTGADFFGQMVANLLVANQPDLAPWHRQK